MVLKTNLNRFNYFQLIGLGIHIGHSLKNTIYYASWLIYGFRREISIINLFKFITMFRLGFYFINTSVFRSLPIWFVSKDRLFDKYIHILASKCGEFSSTVYWIRGMLSNFSMVSKTSKKVKILSNLVRSVKHRLFYLNFKNWFLTRFRRPGLIFVSSVFSNYFVVNEAFFSNIVCLGISDTNAFVQNCSLAVPGNDDTIDCIIFYNDIVSEYILYRKFVSIFLWFLFIRKSKRLLGFNHWVSLINGLKKTDVSVFFNLDYYPHFNFNSISLRFFFAKDFWLYSIYEDLSLNIFKSKGISYIVDFFQSSSSKFLFLFGFYFYKRIIYCLKKDSLRKAYRRKFKMANRRIFLRLFRLSSFKFKRIYFLSKIFFLNDYALVIDYVKVFLSFLIFIKLFFRSRRRLFDVFNKNMATIMLNIRKEFFFFLCLGFFKKNRFFLKDYKLFYLKNFSMFKFSIAFKRKLKKKSRFSSFLQSFKKKSLIVFRMVCWDKPFFDFLLGFILLSSLPLSSWFWRVASNDIFYSSLVFLPRSLFGFLVDQTIFSSFFSGSFYRYNDRGLFCDFFFWSLGLKSKVNF